MRTVARLLPAVLLVLASVAAVAPPPPPPGGVPATRAVEGKTHVLLGAGQSADYQLALYVEETEARRHFPALAMRAGGKQKARLTASDHAQAFVLWGRFTKLLYLHAAHELPAEKLRKELAAGLAEELGDKATPDLKKWSDELVALFAKDLKEGEELVITVDGDGHLYVDQGSDRREAPQSPKLARAFLGVWLGAKAASPELRKALVDRVDLLGR